MALILGLVAPAKSAPGEGDPGFGICGILLDDYGAHEFIEDFAIQSDGKILGAGYTVPPTARVLLARWFADGTLDPSFGSNGVVIDDLAGFSLLALAMQDDGRIVLGGASIGSGLSIARYQSNGERDPSFGNAGLALTGFPYLATDVIVEPSGKIVASAGSTAEGYGVVRLTADGALDETFGNGGIATSTSEGIYDPYPDLARQSDEKLVVAGSLGDEFFLTRFTSTGTADSTFGTTGTVLTDVAAFAPDFANDLILQSDGKLVIAGESNDDILLARFTTTGTLDTSFGSSGTVVDDLGLGAEETALAVATDAAGGIVASGVVIVGDLRYFLVARYTDTGTPDPSFGDGGYLLITGGIPYYFNNVAIEPDDQILVGGAIHLGADVDFLMMRLQGEFPSGLNGYVLEGFAGTHPFATANDLLPACANSAPYFDSDIARGAVVLPDSSGGFIADGSGGIHPFGVWLAEPPPAVSGAPYFAGSDIARDLVLHPSGSGGYLLDGFGGIHPFSWGGDPLPTAAVGAPYFGSDIARDIVVLPDGSGGYMLDGLGGVHPFGIGSPAPPTATGLPYFGFDIARALQLNPAGPGGFILDGYGGIHPFSGATATAGAPYFAGFDIARDLLILSGGTGGYVLDGFGGIHPFQIGAGPMPPAASGVPYFGFDIARRFAVFPELVDSLGPARPKGAEVSDGKPTPRRIPSSMLIDK